MRHTKANFKRVLAALENNKRETAKLERRAERLSEECAALARERDRIENRLKQMIHLQIKPAHDEQMRTMELAEMVLTIDLGTFRYEGEHLMHAMLIETSKQLVEEIIAFGKKQGRIL